MDNEYLDVYEDALKHQREHGGLGGLHDIKRRYSWAVPNEEALTTIAAHSPRGVVEIGAGGGYWTRLLRDRGVDVIAYDPQPVDSKWHDGRLWSEVLQGDHTAIIGHADRTLFLCWPSYDEAWTHEVVELYDGDIIVYIGEGSGGCTGDDRMHALLGEQAYCWHDDEPCACAWPAAKFHEVETVSIPQWWGLHDVLAVYKRIR